MIVRNIANIITFIRMILSMALLFVVPLSVSFFIIYLLCGFSDMIDGPIARKTGNATPFGARIDSLADLIFLTVCLIKLLPVFDVPSWLWLWIVLIFSVKIINVISGFVYCKKLVMLHTTANKITGLTLFLLPIAFEFVGLEYPAILACLVASFAAIQEGRLIRTKNNDLSPI